MKQREAFEYYNNSLTLSVMNYITQMEITYYMLQDEWDLPDSLEQKLIFCSAKVDAVSLKWRRYKWHFEAPVSKLIIPSGGLLDRQSQRRVGAIKRKYNWIEEGKIGRIRNNNYGGRDPEGIINKSSEGDDS
jgi:hypothetical protein